MGSTSDVGKVRYTWLRVSGRAQRLLSAEWDRCRWVWNQCVEASTAAHRESAAKGVKVECGPARLDKRLTGWRAENEWMAEGSSVAQQQTIRDFGRARAKALKDRKDRKLSPRPRRGMPRFKSKHRAAPSLNYTLRGFVLDGRIVTLAGGIAVRPVWSHGLPSPPSSVRVYRDALGRWWCSFVIDGPQVSVAPQTDRSIGVDWGVTDVAITTSNTHDLPHHQYGRTAAAKLARYQRMMARRKPSRVQPPHAVTRLQNGPRPSSMLTSRRSALTPVVSGPRRWLPISIRSPSKISGRSSWRNRRWHARRPMLRSRPPKVRLLNRLASLVASWCWSTRSTPPLTAGIAVREPNTAYRFHSAPTGASSADTSRHATRTPHASSSTGLVSTRLVPTA
jgi:hypothetical protein